MCVFKREIVNEVEPQEQQVRAAKLKVKRCPDQPAVGYSVCLASTSSLTLTGRYFRVSFQLCWREDHFLYKSRSLKTCVAWTDPWLWSSVLSSRWGSRSVNLCAMLKTFPNQSLSNMWLTWNKKLLGETEVWDQHPSASPCKLFCPVKLSWPPFADAGGFTLDVV